MRIVIVSDTVYPEVNKVFEIFLDFQKYIQAKLNTDELFGSNFHVWLVDNKNDQMQDRLDLFSQIGDWDKYVKNCTSDSAILFLKKVDNDSYFGVFSLTPSDAITAVLSVMKKETDNLFGYLVKE